MPPTSRSSRSGRQFDYHTTRGRSGLADHGIFEGIPVRRWTRQPYTVNQLPKPEEHDYNARDGYGDNQPSQELPMPKDSQLLTPTSRALLRAARAGCIYIRHVDKEPGEGKETTEPEGPGATQRTDRTAEHTDERSFTARKWMRVPRHMEPPEFEYLARRRPGLPPLYGVAAKADGGADNVSPMRRTKFQRVDPATGNISVYEAWVPEGYKIEGEVTDGAQMVSGNGNVTVKPEDPAPGTIVDGVGIVDPEGVVVAEAGSAAVMVPRRRPPPRRKGRGYGKGRRKKVMFAPGEGADANTVHGGGDNNANADTTTGAKKEDQSHVAVERQPAQDDDDDDDGEDSDADESTADAKTSHPTTPNVSQSPSKTSTQPTDTAASTTPVKADVDKKLPGQDLASIPASEKSSEPQAVPGASDTAQGTTAEPASGVPVAKMGDANDRQQMEDTDMTDAPPSSTTPTNIPQPVSQSSPETRRQSIKESITEPTTLNSTAEGTTTNISTTANPQSCQNIKTEDATVPVGSSGQVQEKSESTLTDPEPSNVAASDGKETEAVRVPEQGENANASPTIQKTVEQLPQDKHEPKSNSAGSEKADVLDHHNHKQESEAKQENDNSGNNNNNNTREEQSARLEKDSKDNNAIGPVLSSSSSSPSPPPPSPPPKATETAKEG